MLSRMGKSETVKFYSENYKMERGLGFTAARRAESGFPFFFFNSFSYKFNAIVNKKGILFRKS